MAQALPYLVILACPISMGLMMWYMMRSQKGPGSGQQQTPDGRIARLEREIEMLRAPQDQSGRSRSGPPPEQESLRRSVGPSA